MVLEKEINESGDDKRYETICRDVQNKLQAQEDNLFDLQDEVQVIGNKVETISKEVDYLLKLIRDGNGKPSVISQIYLFNNLMTDFKEKLETFGSRMDSMDKLCIALEVEKVKAKWQMLIVLVAGGLSFFSSVVIIIFKFFLS